MTELWYPTILTQLTKSRFVRVTTVASQLYMGLISLDLLLWYLVQGYIPGERE